MASAFAVKMEVSTARILQQTHLPTQKRRLGGSLKLAQCALRGHISIHRVHTELRGEQQKEGWAYDVTEGSLGFSAFAMLGIEQKIKEQTDNSVGFVRGQIDRLTKDLVNWQLSDIWSFRVQQQASSNNLSCSYDRITFEFDIRTTVWHLIEWARCQLKVLRDAKIDMHTSILSLEFIIHGESNIARPASKESLSRLQISCYTWLKDKYLSRIIPALVFVTRLSKVVRNSFADGKPTDLEERKKSGSIGLIGRDDPSKHHKEDDDDDDEDDEDDEEDEEEEDDTEDEDDEDDEEDDEEEDDTEDEDDEDDEEDDDDEDEEDEDDEEDDGEHDD